MKIFLNIVLVFIVFVSGSCNKEGKLLSKLEGTWELRHIEGGFRPINSPSDYAPGNGILLKFEANTFQQSTGAQTDVSGTFTIVKEEVNLNGEKLLYKIDFQSEKNMPDAYFKISGDKLFLYVGEIAADGYVGIYEKQ
ncbi:hypothetical protein [Daejeonella sp. H1SJ63]|jgi:hypothetical protein|uniref:hypothetical protein n=1 Tax=Daejeonella sp. H1SJ63 TaxID=3034145 RepID=UPI0023ECDF58|nr:hypothetical protein [Daejeonella sp. H1SJ63]